MNENQYFVELRSLQLNDEQRKKLSKIFKPNRMKNAIILFFVLLISSCTSSKIIELGGKAADKGTEVSQKGIDIYTTLSQQSDVDRYQQDKVKVLTHPNPIGMPLPATSPKGFPKQLSLRIKAFQSLLNVYKVFGLLTDKEYSNKTSDAVSALRDAYASISTLPDLPADVSALLPGVAGAIANNIQARKIKQHNLILFELTKAYLTLWNKEQPLWEDYIEQVYIRTYADALKGDLSNRYDPARVAEISKEPYNNNVIVLMYRLKERDDIINSSVLLKKQLNDFGKALSGLNKAHSEISKQRPDIQIAISTINSIENLLNQK